MKKDLKELELKRIKKEKKTIFVLKVGWTLGQLNPTNVNKGEDAKH